MSNITVKPSQATEIIEATLKAKLVPFIKGSPGIGKSSIIRTIADKYNLEVIDLRLSQCDPTDLNGFPNLKGNKATYLPMDTFPLEGDTLPNGKEGWCIFLDEFNSAPISVQAAAYKLVLDRQVGLHKLHEKVVIVCAGNLETDNAIVHSMSTALQSRLVHLTLKYDNEEWTNWAIKNKINPIIISYLQYKPTNGFNFNPESPDDTYPCPRTWEFASRLMEHIDIDTITGLYALAGTIGEGTARELLTFIKVYKDLPTINQIIANPETVIIPEEISSQYALTGLISSNANENNFTQLMKFVSRLPIEYQIITLQHTMLTHPTLSNHNAYVEWVRKNAVSLQKNMYE